MGVGQPLYCALRYFDPVQQRPGLPEGVGALVEKLTNQEVVVTLVNLSPIQARPLVLQAGAYAEHQLVSAVIGERRLPIGRSWMELRLEPGCGSRIVLELRRHVNQPTLALPLGSHVEHAEKPDEPERSVERFWDEIFRNPTLLASCCR